VQQISYTVDLNIPPTLLATLTWKADEGSLAYKQDCLLNFVYFSCNLKNGCAVISAQVT
jgi:hypothetical protein